MVDQAQQAKSSFLSLLITIAIPSFLLMVSKKQDYFSSEFVLIIALLFPIGFALYEFKIAKKVSFLAVFGFVSILLTGGIGLLKLPSEWIAIKESMIPFTIGMVILVLALSGKSSMKFIISPLLDLDKIESILIKNKLVDQLRKILLFASLLLSMSFFVSSMLNYFLARMIVKSPSGTDAFNHELGVLTALSYPVIAIPSVLVMMLSIWYVVYKLKKLTQLNFMDMLKEEFRQ